MSDLSMGQDAAAPQGGLFERALSRMFLRSTRVSAVRPVSARFFLIDLEGDALRGVAWAPGQKLQIKVGRPLATRTFTPLSFDAARATTCLLGYAHGAGPGSDWLRRVRPGDPCEVFGPHRSLQLDALSGPVVLFGDETSIGLAAALHHSRSSGVALRCLFEVRSMQEASAALRAIDVSPTAMVERGDQLRLETHLREVLAQTGDATRFVLTGQAQSIQRVKQLLKRDGVPAARMMAKAFWSPGKKGLD